MHDPLLFIGFCSKLNCKHIYNSNSLLMKKFIFILCIVSLGFINTINAQNPQYKTGISVKGLFMDYQSLNGGDFSNFRDYHSGFEIGYHKLLTDRLVLNVPLKVGVVQSHEPVEWLHKSLLGLDVKGQYLLSGPMSQFQPYVIAGIGAVAETEGDFNLQVPAGIGVNIKLEDRAYINFQSEFRYSLKEDRNNLHHGIGFVYLLGKKAMEDEEKEMMEGDSDGDGLVDEIDLCPQQAGPKELSGCPDSDMDGIADYEDQCPTDAGPVEMQGCPDSDGDGVSDATDECPNMAGDPANNGCPSNNDRDGDGIGDAIDNCPDQAGPASNNGCPDNTTDTDGDGIVDANDRCPNRAGLASNGGCPEAQDRDRDGIDDSEDQCPDIPGIAAYAGCPGGEDSDGDGLRNDVDRCPLEAGPISNNGCPDTGRSDRDGDGVDDVNDNCPDEAGSSATNGCPDSDGDGVANNQDRCPNQSGLRAYQGCPDSDGDGIDDSRDNCPNEPGSVASGGCPDTPRVIVTTPTTDPIQYEQPSGSITLSGVGQDDVNYLEQAMRSVQFSAARSTLKRESLEILNQIADIKKRYPNHILSISGHTDSQGSAEVNLALSRRRAQAVYEYLATRGIGISEMTYEGFGSSKPISSNATLSGRQLNRRVEFILLPK